jgi:hypothetical protein
MVLIDTYRTEVHNPSDTLSLSIKSLPVHESHTLQTITNDEIQSLKTRFSNLNLLSTSYDAKMGQLPASKLVYSYTDYDDNSDKKAMQINALKGHYKAIFITYTALTQDFDKFLPTVTRIIGSFSANG